MFDISETWFNY